jgi:hypothetical protein
MHATQSVHTSQSCSHFTRDVNTFESEINRIRARACVRVDVRCECVRVCVRVCVRGGREAALMCCTVRTHCLGVRSTRPVSQSLPSMRWNFNFAEVETRE